MRESAFQTILIKDLHVLFPGCVVLKNDTLYQQGIPDLLVLYRNRWAMLEVKASADAPEQPNQAYYIDLFNGMSFAAFIYPENEEDVLYELQQSFSVRRQTRVSKR
jgi:hypothetical protein